MKNCHRELKLSSAPYSHIGLFSDSVSYAIALPQSVLNGGHFILFPILFGVEGVLFP